MTDIKRKFSNLQDACLIAGPEGDDIVETVERHLPAISWRVQAHLEYGTIIANIVDPRSGRKYTLVLYEEDLEVHVEYPSGHRMVTGIEKGVVNSEFLYRNRRFV